ncbi:hypothetical protein FLK61_26490 [Paenalkalicoccus suaedae]|uniref:Uncharacterized protein n=1 Tax=Paenalkalicoccus suaedae TaxID=2592382 RepID=A0A859FBH7_9BACI|nr:hypothetical protein [Paenalkalicoccus suaedae]QKS70310.1 hypothetical protein FLK61_26490 [Paenalkalicoccus suaedae]
MDILILLGVLVLIAGINYAIFRLTALHRPSRVIAGVVTLLALPPLSYWATFYLMLPNDSGAFNSVLVAFLVASFFVINGIVLLISTAFA